MPRSSGTARWACSPPWWPAKLCSSNREARQLVQQGGVLVDGEKVTDPTFAFAAEQLQKGVVIKKGKKVYHKVTL